MSSKYNTVSETWKSNEMTQQEERVFVQDTTAIIQAQSIRQDIGLVSSGVQRNL